jgi:hypothetical protein
VTVKVEHDMPERELAYPHSPRTSAPAVQQTPATTVTNGNPFMSYHSAEARVPGRFAQAMQVATPPPIYLGVRVGAESIDYASVLKTPPMSPSLLSPASDPDLCTSILAATSSYGSLPGYSQPSQFHSSGPPVGSGGALAFGDEYDSCKAKLQSYWLPRQA